MAGFAGRCIASRSPANGPSDMTQLAKWSAPTTERDARIELAAAYRMVHDFGWTDLGATHLSAAVPGEDAYLMLQSGLLFDEVTASNLVKIGHDGEVRHAGVPAAGPGEIEVNPAGVTIHTALHAARPDIGSVMHTHTVAGMAVSTHPEGMLPLSQHSLRFWGCHGTHDYEGIALDDEEGPRLAADLGAGELLLLRNHGLLTVGPDVPSALSALYYAEVSCRVQVAALSSTREPVLPSDEACTTAREQYEAGLGYMYRDWMALLRTVEATHPDFCS